MANPYLVAAAPLHSEIAEIPADNLNFTYLMNTKRLGVCLWMGLPVWAPRLAWAARADARLADAVMRADRETVRSLLQQKIDVNATQPDGMTALHWAVRADDRGTPSNCCFAPARK